MANAMNRLSYDVNTYKFDLAQSMGPGAYRMFTPEPNCQPCFQTDARVQNGTTGGAECADRPLVDVDSELLGLTRPATNCPKGKYLPGKCAPCPLRDRDVCANTRPTEDTRLSNPPCTLRGTGWNRWEWLCKDPQLNALTPFDSMVSNRIIVKDNHRPALPKPLDQTISMPPGAIRDYAPHPETEWVSWVHSCKQTALNGGLLNTHWRSCSDVATIKDGAVPRM